MHLLSCLKSNSSFKTSKIQVGVFGLAMQIPYTYMQPHGSLGRTDAGSDSRLDPLRPEPRCAAFHLSGMVVCKVKVKKQSL